MAGIQLAPRGHCHIFRAAATAGNSLIDAGAMLQIQHIMIEGQRSALFFALQHFLRQQLILLEKNGLILFCQRIRVIRRADNRLHTQLRKAQIRHVEQIIRKIYIIMGKGSTHIVVFIPTLFHKFLELRHNAVIAAVACIILAQMVMHFPSAVQRKHNIVHFLIRKLNNLIINQHTVCGQRKTEVFIMQLFLLSGIGHHLLNHIPVHQGLAAEEVHLKVSSCAGIFNQKINRTLADLKCHERTFPLIFALTGEAIGAVQVAGMRNMQAQRLNHRISRLEIIRQIFIIIGRKQLACPSECHHIVNTFLHILRCDIVIFFEHGINDIPLRILANHADDIIRQIIYAMDGATAGVQHDVVTIQFILMYHFSTSSLC